MNAEESEPESSRRPARPGGDAPAHDVRAGGQGLCPRCVHVKVVTSAKGSVFRLCTRSLSDPRYPRYPPQPVVVCAGFEG